MIANGRDRITIAGMEFMPERETAAMLRIPVMRLRRSAILPDRLQAVRFWRHTYYHLESVKALADELSGYYIRQNMKSPPMSVEARKKRNETIVAGLTCYPRPLPKGGKDGKGKK